MAPALGQGCPAVPRAPGPHAPPTSPASCLKSALKFSSISSSESTCWTERRESRSGAPQPSLRHGLQLEAGLGALISAVAFTSLSLTLLICKVGTQPLSSLSMRPACGG